MELLPIREYTEKIEAELKTLDGGANLEKLAEAFANADGAQTGTIDKFDLAMVLEKEIGFLYIYFLKFRDTVWRYSVGVNRTFL